MRQAYVDELTGLEVTYDPDEVSYVVTIGWLAYSTHASNAAAKAWMQWNMTPEMRAMAKIIPM